MQNLNRMHTAPIDIPRTTRRHVSRGITSMPAGKMVPLAAIPLLREDSVRTGRYRHAFEMAETYDMLMNNVNVRVMAYLVPTLAFERFGGSMDILNRSYMGEPAIDGGSVVPFVENSSYYSGSGSGSQREIYKYLGVHAKPDAQINTAYCEAYNLIWNFRAKNRSKDIDERARLEHTLAPAFWLHENFAHIVPDFDQAKIDGEVPLNVVAGRLPLTDDSGNFGGQGATLRVKNYPSQADNQALSTSSSSAVFMGASQTGVDDRRMYADLSEVYAEMQENGITVSLSNLELARKTQAFARMRERYQGIDDEWVIDMLMSGMTIPDQALKQPMLLADRRAVFGQAKRYATDHGNMAESVTNGVALVDLAFRVPRLSTGGVVMIVAEIMPEQLFERQKDPYFHATGVDDFPDALPDLLDPEKVEVVQNDYVDVDHDAPTDTFGFAPLNFKWDRNAPTVGGKFFRPAVDGQLDEDRQRFWAAETADPTLSTDFYLVTGLKYTPFLITDTAVDPFECVTVGECSIGGNTQFGHMLIEASDDYEKVLAKVDQSRIEKDGEE